MTLVDARQHVTQPNGWTDCNPIGHAIHHTVTMMLSPNATQQDEINQIQAIDAYHVDQGFGGFGYHTITFPSGRSYLTGTWNRARAHVMYRNHELVGSVAAGTFTNDLAPPAIVEGLRECVIAARVIFRREMPVRGHGTWADPRSPSSCPGRIREQINSIVQPTPVEEDDMLNAEDKAWISQEIAKQLISILRSEEMGLPGISARTGRVPSPTLADMMKEIQATKTLMETHHHP